MNADIAAAFLIGFIGSSHCLVMCGGIVAALQLSMPTTRWSTRLALQLLLSAGRLCSYAFFGALVGYFGVVAMQVSGASMLWLRLLAGLLLIAMALYISRLWNLLQYLERGGQHLWRLIQPLSNRLMPLDSPLKAFGYGVCWGWLPCGLVYSTLSWSLASGSALSGAAIMFAFGLGTLPAILLTAGIAAKLNQLKQQLWFRYGTAALLGIYGLYTVWLAIQRLVF
ncbi:sulfite exporter TauE/SafE family protein [Alkalimonas collagenimarina]|uniref:Sulfite exporter TauE/SafE family protein n=1 Tax=Alkalimonas collagenimarina TaxID=400390 RepID=A0ABT9H2V5_9GAMM|nr:sulfite exporter TauE/SafE family protein [Alkalimonas collagenimarina]MDP4537399.1 sulfite exporter TauE/SafE family protein [Alkalimonas collagenimarina]